MKTGGQRLLPPPVCPASELPQGLEGSRHVRRQRRGKGNLLAGRGMGESQRMSVQCLAIDQDRVGIVCEARPPDRLVTGSISSAIVSRSLPE